MREENHYAVEAQDVQVDVEEHQGPADLPFQVLGTPLLGFRTRLASIGLLRRRRGCRCRHLVLAVASLRGGAY